MAKKIFNSLCFILIWIVLIGMGYLIGFFAWSKEHLGGVLTSLIVCLLVAAPILLQIGIGIKEGILESNRADQPKQ